MAYEFENPLELLLQRNNQPAQSQADTDFFLQRLQQPADNRTTNEKINDGILAESQQQNKPVLLGQDLALAKNILANKQAYEDAQMLQNQAERQALQNQAHDYAQNTRKLANALNLNLDDYGENVTLQDTRNALAQNQYRALKDAINRKYSLSSDDWFNRRYKELRDAGYSDRSAKGTAAVEAQQYKAERMNYLDNVFNSFGRNERGGITDVGQMLMQRYAQDNPVGANLYTSLSPGLLNDYNFDNSVALAELADKLGYGVRADTYNYNAQLQDLIAQNKEKAAQAQQARELGTYENKKIIDEKYKEQQPDKIDEAIKQATKIGQLNGLTGDDLNKFVLEYVNKAFSGGGKTETANKFDPSYANVLQKDMEHTFKVWDELKNDPNASPEEVQRAQVNHTKSSSNYYNYMGQFELPTLTGNKEEDINSFASIIQRGAVEGRIKDRDQAMAVMKTYNKWYGNRYSEEELDEILNRFIKK